MPAFSQASKDKLATCHLELQLLFNTVIRTFDCQVTEGYRNQVDQDAAFARGASKLKYPNGKHNQMPSMAADVLPFPVDWANTKRFYWFGGYVLGIADTLFLNGVMKHRVKFGGDWDRDFDLTDEKGLQDLVHFELVVPKA